MSRAILFKKEGQVEYCQRDTNVSRRHRWRGAPVRRAGYFSEITGVVEGKDERREIKDHRRQWKGVSVQ